MRLDETDIPDAVVVTPELHPDGRGVFLEWFRQDELTAATGRAFSLAQANISVSRRGTVRGVHLARVPPGQAKYVTVIQGRILDVLVDLRVGSPTFLQSVSVELDEVTRRAVFVPEGVGHLLAVHSDTATICYLVDEVYSPENEFTVSALDPALGLELPFSRDELVLSDRDRAAPRLDEVRSAGLLPTWDECRAHYGAER